MLRECPRRVAFSVIFSMWARSNKSLRWGVLCHRSRRVGTKHIGIILLVMTRSAMSRVVSSASIRREILYVVSISLRLMPLATRRSRLLRPRERPVCTNGTPNRWASRDPVISSSGVKTMDERVQAPLRTRNYVYAEGKTARLVFSDLLMPLCRILMRKNCIYVNIIDAIV